MHTKTRKKKCFWSHKLFILAANTEKVQMACITKEFSTLSRWKHSRIELCQTKESIRQFCRCCCCKWTCPPNSVRSTSSHCSERKKRWCYIFISPNFFFRFVFEETEKNSAWSFVHSCLNFSHCAYFWTFLFLHVMLSVEIARNVSLGFSWYFVVFSLPPLINFD